MYTFVKSLGFYTKDHVYKKLNKKKDLRVMSWSLTLPETKAVILSFVAKCVSSVIILVAFINIGFVGEKGGMHLIYWVAKTCMVTDSRFLPHQLISHAGTA